MGKGKKLLLLVLAVAFLTGGYFAVKHFLADDKQDMSDTHEEAIPVNAMQVDDIQQIEYLFGDEKIVLVREQDKWSLVHDPEFPVKQTLAQAMASLSASLSAVRLVSDNPDDFAEYGLSEPETAYLFTLHDGTKVTYFLGNYNSFGSTYYMNVAGTNQIYLISDEYLQAFDHGLSDLADVAAMPEVSTDQVHDLTMTLDGKTTRVFKNNDGQPTVYSDKFTWFFDEQTPADSVAARYLVGAVSAFVSGGCASYKSDADTLEAFGLTDPVLTAELEYTVTEEKDTGEFDENDEPITETVSEEQTLTLLVGGAYKDGRLCAKTDHSDTVYLIQPDYLQDLRDFNYDDLQVSDICAVQTTDVQSMDVTINGKTSSIRITREQNGADTEKIVYQLDGKQISPSRFNEFFSCIQTMQSEGTADQTVQMDDAPITVVYHTSRNGFETITLCLKPFDANFYVSELDDDYGKLVNKRDVENLINVFNLIGES